MNRRRHNAAFTAVELVVMLAALIALAFILFSALSRAPHAIRRSQCVNNLKQIGLSTHFFAAAHRGLFPASYHSNQIAAPTFNADDHFAFLINEISTPKILHCPADAARRPAHSMGYLSRTNISYFTSLSAVPARPQDFFAGDRNLTINGTQPAPAKVIVLPDDKLGWTSDIHKDRGNILMADFSVHQFTSTRLHQSTATSTNLLLFP